MSNHFERLTRARTETGEAVKHYALAMLELERIRGDRKAAAEDIYALAQETRRAEQTMNEAIKRECMAVVSAHESSNK